MGWRFPWVSSGGCDFNRDFGVSFTKEEVASGAKAYNFGTIPPHGEENPGLSFFYKDPSGAVFHTYSTYGRGLEAMLGTYAILDRAPKGRDEDGLPIADGLGAASRQIRTDCASRRIMLPQMTRTSTDGCCHGGSRPPPRRPLHSTPHSLPHIQRPRGFVAGAFSLGLWALVPKCPLCLAAYVTLWTGLGLSFAEAMYLRWSLLSLSGVLFAYLIYPRRLSDRSSAPGQTGLQL